MSHFEPSVALTFDGRVCGNLSAGLLSYGVDSDELSIRKELMTYGSVEVAFLVFADFFHYSSGVYRVRWLTMC